MDCPGYSCRKTRMRIRNPVQVQENEKEEDKEQDEGKKTRL